MLRKVLQLTADRVPLGLRFTNETMQELKQVALGII